MSMKYRPWIFLEIDDLVTRGGRKVVGTLKDGVTFFDFADTEIGTPIVIHPVFNVRVLGTLTDVFLASPVARQKDELMRYLREQGGDIEPLFLARVVWALTQAAPSDGVVFTESDFASAREAALTQHENARRVHGYAEAYCTA